MKDILKFIIDNLLNSFSTNELGWSARKLTAFIITLLVIIAHVKWITSCYRNSDFSLLPEILIIDFSTILTLLGLTTWERLKIFKKGDSSDNNKIDININTKGDVDGDSNKDNKDKKD
jgi:hypothetical protein